MPGSVVANNLIYRRHDKTIARDEKILLPRSRDYNIEPKKLLEIIMKEKSSLTNQEVPNGGTIDPVTGEVVLGNIGTTARRREQQLNLNINGGANTFPRTDDDEEALFGSDGSLDNHQLEEGSALQTPLSSQSSGNEELDDSEAWNGDS